MTWMPQLARRGRELDAAPDDRRRRRGSPASAASGIDDQQRAVGRPRTERHRQALAAGRSAAMSFGAAAALRTMARRVVFAETAPCSMTCRRLPGIAAPLSAARLRRRRSGSRASPTRRAAARHQRARRHLRLRAARRARAADARGAGVERQDRQPDAAHRREQRRPAQQARGGARSSARRPAARSATWRTTRFSALVPGDRAHRRRARAPRYRERFVAYLHDVQDDDLSARHRDDRREGRPQQAAARAGQPRQLRAHRRAQRQGHRHLGHQGDRHRRRRTCTSSWSCRAAT